MSGEATVALTGIVVTYGWTCQHCGQRVKLHAIADPTAIPHVEVDREMTGLALRVHERQHQ